jgi:hypothetical protein
MISLNMVVLPRWHIKTMLLVQFVDRIFKVNIQWNLGSKHTLQHNDGYQQHTHIGLLEW